MKFRTFLCILWLMLIGCVLSCNPVLAQEDMDDDCQEEVTSKKSKKGKKSRKGGKKTKAAKTEVDEEDSDEPKEKAAPAKPATPKVVEALGKFKVFNAKPNLKADYFIYLYSSSTCGHCQACMPVAVAEYKKMKSSRKVELIVICGDKSEDDAKKYMKSKKLKAPTIMFGALQATQFRGLPGCGMPGLPAISVVDKEGNMIKNVVGASAVQETLSGWKELTIAR